ncbi:class II aldolase/adducin family protein [Glaciibacter psychrotolerans]|uniref:L-fuculose-phosphate aldolase n=1 Tax=Glaciibacter psychrotolerans TaxID=670054 RepID=A0A7Z0EFM3_9MICO|nr:class II aldolase/adducin family protein [Leifsonia psychrotolerans]NYJ20793.1 L-fuculose-phosphate aldolase [Leifsonia psychrotolerans]
MQFHHTDLVDQLIAAGRTVVERGLALASGGNLSARVPGSDSFIVTRSGAWLNSLVPDDFSVLGPDGQVISGSAHPSSEWKLHAYSYQARPDANAIVHVHPQMAVLLDALGAEIRLITLDHAYYVRSVGRTPYYPNGSDELARTAAEQAREHDCVIQGNHGCSTLGANVEMALRRALNLEEAATLTYRALALGDTTTAFPRDAFEGLAHS